MVSVYNIRHKCARLSPKKENLATDGNFWYTGAIDNEVMLMKTAGDVLMYMLAAQTGDNGGCYCTDWDGYTWHTNFTAKEVMERKLSNCGASANLANYLLEGDYEEVGFILHAYYPGNGGVSLAIAHTSTGQHLPNIFGEQYGEPYYYVPEGSAYTLLYEAGDGYLIAEKPLDKKYHDYTLFWPDYRSP